MATKNRAESSDGEFHALVQASACFDGESGTPRDSKTTNELNRFFHRKETFARWHMTCGKYGKSGAYG